MESSMERKSKVLGTFPPWERKFVGNESSLCGFLTKVLCNKKHSFGQLSMSRQVAAVCRSCFFQIRQLKSVKSSLTREALHSLIQSFVHCRLDYCNSALAGVSKVYL